MSSYQTLIAQAEELRAKAEQERRAVIDRIKGEIAAYTITGEDLGFTVKKPASEGGAPRGRKPGTSKANGAMSPGATQVAN
jgi:DNA-binding protein H-NS